MTPEEERGVETGGQRTPGTLTASAFPASISQEGGDSPLPGIFNNLEFLLMTQPYKRSTNRLPVGGVYLSMDVWINKNS